MFRPNWRSSLNDPYFSYRRQTPFNDPHYSYGRQNRNPRRYNTWFNEPQHYGRRNRQNTRFNEQRHYERRNQQNPWYNESPHHSEGRNHDPYIPNRNIFGEKQRCSNTQQQYIKALKEARMQKILKSIVTIQRCWRNYIKRKRLMNAKFNRDSYAIHEIDETPTIPRHRILPDSCPYVLQEIK